MMKIKCSRSVSLMEFAGYTNLLEETRQQPMRTSSDDIRRGNMDIRQPDKEQR